ncbi:MAG: hypothetical protein Q9166_002038 [cf. Caloplaca sp. 2 TL-2023]
MPPTSCQTGDITIEDLRQIVIDSASNMLEAMKNYRSSQSSTARTAHSICLPSWASSSREKQADITGSAEPVILRERAVFLRNVPIPVDRFLIMQRSFRQTEEFINKALVSNAELDQMGMEVFGKAALNRPDEDEILLRCALREVHEARLNTELQMAGLTHTEIGQVDLLEQVWEEHGIPNACEEELLSQLTGDQLQHIHGWFDHKRANHKAYAANRRKMFPPSEARRHELFLIQARQYFKKPYTRH